MKRTLVLLLSLLVFAELNAQAITSRLYDSYEQFKEEQLSQRRFKHEQIINLMEALKSDPQFEIRTVGHSIEGRSLHLISVGSGTTDVFLWSQMHGDEPTATQAIFDIFNFLKSSKFSAEKKDLLSKLRIHFLPMLNPDGAERYQRRNALGVDINRDALRLQSPESRTLKRIRDSLEADFGFNLHDQSRYYNAFRTEKPATISYLAPAYDYEKSVNTVRANAMRVIVMMNRIIQKYAPGQVGSYNDAFEPRAFGDNLQKWGTSTILIESGGYQNDREKQEIRKLNYVSILSAIFSIADQSYKKASLSEYEAILRNDRKLFDLKVENLSYNLLGSTYQLDIGINHFEYDLPGNEDFYYRSGVVDQGDLSTYYGYKTIKAQGLSLKYGQVYPKVFAKITDLEEVNFKQALKDGYLYFRVANFAEQQPSFHDYPCMVVGEDFALSPLAPGSIPTTFLLSKEGDYHYAIINGFVYDLKANQNSVKNGLILKK